MKLLLLGNDDSTRSELRSSIVALGYDVADNTAWNFPNALSSQSFDCILIADDVPETQSQAIAPVVKSVRPKAILIRVSSKLVPNPIYDHIVPVAGNELSRVLELLIHRDLLRIRLQEVEEALEDPALEPDIRKMMMTVRKELGRALNVHSNDDSAVA